METFLAGLENRGAEAAYKRAKGELVTSIRSMLILSLVYFTNIN